MVAGAGIISRLVHSYCITLGLGRLNRWEQFLRHLSLSLSSPCGLLSMDASGQLCLHVLRAPKVCITREKERGRQMLYHL